MIGSARDLSVDPAGFVMQAGRANGGLAEIRSYRRVFVAVTDPDFVRQILLARHQKYRRAHGFGRPLIGEGLLSIGGAGAQQRRRQVGSIFRFDMLDRVMPLVREEIDRELGRWEEVARTGGLLPLANAVRRLVILGLTRAMLSEMGTEDRNELAEIILEGLKLTERRNGGVPRFPYALPTPAHLHLKRVIRRIDGRLQPNVLRRREGAADERRDLVDALVAARDPESGEALTDVQVVAEVKGMLAAGIDSGARVISGALERLASHPDAANVWHSEVDRELDRRLPERADLPRLTRLTQIVNETLRLCPPVPTLSRECIETDVIGGYVIPRGTRLLLSIQAVHRDGRYWVEPDEFRPGRFAREWPRHAFMPFGVGQHGCIADNFALAQILITLAMIGQRFRIAPAETGAGRPRGPRTSGRSEEMLVRVTRRA